MTQGTGGSSRRESETESSSSLESRNPPRRSSASDSLPPQRRYTYRQLLVMPNQRSLLFHVAYESDMVDLLIFKFMGRSVSASQASGELSFPYFLEVLVEISMTHEFRYQINSIIIF